MSEYSNHLAGKCNFACRFCDNKTAKAHYLAARRDIAREKGNCIVHRDVKAISKSYCQKCIDIARDRSEKRTLAGMCATHPDRPRASKTKCQECLDAREGIKQGRIERGICWVCGVSPPDKAGRCQPCVAIAKDQNLRRIFKITINDYNQMLAAQGGVCWICDRKSKDGRDLAVDHCHTTGKVRGLLCAACNTSLGAVKDSTQTLENMIQYLAR